MPERIGVVVDALTGDVLEKFAIVRHLAAHGRGGGAFEIKVRRGVAADGDERMPRQRAQLRFRQRFLVDQRGYLDAVAA